MLISPSADLYINFYLQAKRGSTGKPVLGFLIILKFALFDITNV